MVRGRILVPLLQHPPCTGACCPAVRSQEREDCVCSATSQLSEGQRHFGACGTNIRHLCLLVTSLTWLEIIRGELKNEMLLSLAFFWQVLTLLLQCAGAPYTLTSSTEISGTELHTVVCSRRLVLHLVINISQPGAASSHQATWHRCALVSSAYGRFF